MLVLNGYSREVEGSDTVILFIHGILGGPSHFDMFIPNVPDDWSICGILLDGHGKGVEDISSTSMEKWKAQVADKISELYLKYKNIIIAAHSMGTLFAIDAALKYPDKVKMLFLLAVPLRIFIKPIAAVNAYKVIFDRIKDGDVRALAAKDAYNVERDRRLWLYLGWIPRYLELFREMRRVKRVIRSLTVPCFAFQSSDDELVSKASKKYLFSNPNISCELLEHSGHYYYESRDREFLISRFSEECAALCF